MKMKTRMKNIRLHSYGLLYLFQAALLLILFSFNGCFTPPEGPDYGELPGDFSADANLITKWTFSAETTPSIGSGTIEKGSGNTDDFSFPEVSGHGNTLSLNRWHVTGYDSDRFIEYRFSTSGYSRIGISLDSIRSSDGGPDFFRVEYSTDGGTNWAVLPGSTSSILTTDWTTHVFDFSSLAAMDNNSDVRVRFHAWGDGDEAWNSTWRHDNVRIKHSMPSTISTDASLSTLTVDTGTLNPSFSSGTTSYTLEVPSGTLPADIDFTAVPTSLGYDALQFSWPGGSVGGTSGNPVTMTNLNDTEIVEIEVTAEDGTTTETYTFTLDEQAPVVYEDWANLNPSFENGTNDWTTRYGTFTTVALGDDGVLSPTDGISMARLTAFDSNDYQDMIESEKFIVTPGKVIDLSVNVAFSSDDGDEMLNLFFRIRIEFYDSSDNPSAIAPDQRRYTSSLATTKYAWGTWTKNDFVTVPADAAYAKLFINIKVDGGTENEYIYVDNLSVTQN